MKLFGEWQQKAIDLARSKLGKRYRHRGVSVDKVPSEEECRNNLEQVAEQLVVETEYWDDNWQGRK